MCTHQAHMGFDLKKKILKKFQILTEISVCAVCPQILFPNILPWRGIIWKNFRAKYFYSFYNLNVCFPWIYKTIQQFCVFSCCENLRWISVRNLKKNPKIAKVDFYAWCPKILFCLKNHIFLQFRSKYVFWPKIIAI